MEEKEEGGKASSRKKRRDLSLRERLKKYLIPSNWISARGGEPLSLGKMILISSRLNLSLSFLQVLFRYAIAIFKHLEEVLLAQCDYMSIFNTLRTEVEKLSDVKKLTQVSDGSEKIHYVLVCKVDEYPPLSLR